MQSAVLLEKEVSDLRAENEKKKQKRTRSKRQIPAAEGLSVQEASEMIAGLVEASEIPLDPPSGSTQSSGKLPILLCFMVGPACISLLLISVSQLTQSEEIVRDEETARDHW
ncbi:unnamed protein product [Penicillium roqueforti FM164]|uniref:Uncharacterized protein n=1 Tax=Penicillium roqueforti (strain FM164) TaxID=1365484 RepID=W6QPW0_PENRF|nr:unnamed protein product [Penicillium roqueforti FM164]